MQNPDMKMHTVAEALSWASSYLEEHGYESEIARILMLFHTGWSRARLFSEMRESLDPLLYRAFEKDVLTAAGGLPVQYITGTEMFYGRNFHVNPSVLIPRPETEELVEAIFDELYTELPTDLSTSVDKPFPVVDIGTGSGILAVTLALELPERLTEIGLVHAIVSVTATDISPDALSVANENAKGLKAQVSFLEGSFLGPLKEKSLRPRILVSNPPYVPVKDRADMKENVTGHEPHLALFAGEDGLEAYRKIIRDLPDVIHPEGTLVALEIGHDQGEAVKRLIRGTFPAAMPRVLRDINENERIVIVWL